MKIVTHDGKFHADDCVAIAIMTTIFPDAEVTRSRDPNVIANADYVIDVGGGTYDHHQRGGNGSRPRYDGETPCDYAAAGLIWRDFGEFFIEQVCVVDKALVKELHRQVDLRFIQPVDDVDNGVNLVASAVSRIVSEINSLDNGFSTAVEVCRVALLANVKVNLSRVEAFPIVEKAFNNRKDGVIVLDHFVPWQEALLQFDHGHEVKFVVWHDILNKEVANNKWRIQGVPKEAGRFGNIVDFPKDWGGLEGEELVKVSGISDIYFCHHQLFIAGSLSKEGCFEIAKAAYYEAARSVKGST